MPTTTMFRTLFLILSCVSIAVVLTGAAGAGWLWYTGVLSEHNVREIRLILSGQVTAEPEPIVKPDAPKVAYEAVQTQRALRILDLQNRESNLLVLRQQILDEQKRTQERQASLQAEREAFEKKLADLEKEITEAGVEQARGVLMAMPPADAAARLMDLSLDEGLALMKGVPEKTAAKILKELAGTKEKLERGQQLFRAIYKGEPQQSLVEEARSRLLPQSTPLAQTTTATGL